MGMGGNGNSPHGNPMGMGISQKLGNGCGREWELNRWEWEGMGTLKAIPAHLYYMYTECCNVNVCRCRDWWNCLRSTCTARALNTTNQRWITLDSASCNHCVAFVELLPVPYSFALCRRKHIYNTHDHLSVMTLSICYIYGFNFCFMLS